MLTAVILAGGQGLRLRSVVNDRPKVLAPVAGRPFLLHLLDRLAEQGCRRAVISTGYGSDQVEGALGARYRDVSIDYSCEPAPLGTAGALRHALPLLFSEPVLVLNGDSYCDFTLAPFYAWHRNCKSAASLWLTQVADARRYGRVRVAADETVLSFEEKPKWAGTAAAVPSHWINAGVYLLSRRFIVSIPTGRAVSLEREVFAAWLGRGLHGYCCPVPFLDIGTPESYAAAERFFAPRRLAG